MRSVLVRNAAPPDQVREKRSNQAATLSGTVIRKEFGIFNRNVTPPPAVGVPHV